MGAVGSSIIVYLQLVLAGGEFIGSLSRNLPLITGYANYCDRFLKWPRIFSLKNGDRLAKCNWNSPSCVCIPDNQIFSIEFCGFSYVVYMQGAQDALASLIN